MSFMSHDQHMTFSFNIFVAFNMIFNVASQLLITHHSFVLSIIMERFEYTTLNSLHSKAEIMKHLRQMENTIKRIACWVSIAAIEFMESL